MTGFTIEVDQNTYLPAGLGRVDAIVTVTAPDTPVAAPPTDGREIIILPPPRTFAVGSQTTIGRRSRSRGVEPEIDLSGPPLDPGNSMLHAVLLAAPTGGWDLVDVGSRNGTMINDDADPVVPNAPVHLAVGDRIMIGAWTVLTVCGVGGNPQSR